MAEEINVDCRRGTTGWSCQVVVGTAGSQTRHMVSVSDEELRRYAPDHGSPEKLVQASFRFLLEREPKQAILGRFDLSDIERYFPEYGRWSP